MNQNLIIKLMILFIILYIISLLVLSKTNSGNILMYIKHTLNKSKNIKILNFGSGDGLLSKEIYDMGFKNIYNCDIKDLSIDKTIPTIVYDGKIIPFDDNYFDVVIINFVLHHIDTKLHYNILKEIKRVSNNLIIISEDNIDTNIDKILGKLHLLIQNKWNSHSDAFFRTSTEYNILFKNNEVIFK